MTANVIVPDEVIGEPVIVNSDEPESVTATDVTVPVKVGCIWENVIVSVSNVALVSVVHKKILSAFVEPSWTITNCPAVL